MSTSVIVAIVLPLCAIIVYLLLSYLGGRGGERED